MMRLRDEKGRYVRESNSNDSVVVGAACFCVVLMVALAWWTIMHESTPAPPPEPQVIVQPAPPIDWEKVTVHAIPVKAWQDEHDHALMRRLSKELQRVIDRNEARATPAFPKHH